MSAATGPLSGLVIADFSRVLAGPYATMLMGDLGAEVIKIERPGQGDDTRAWGPPWNASGSTYFQSVNRNKSTVVCDLKSVEGRQDALELCRTADVVIENFRSGTMEAMELGYETLQAANPGLVYCAITGFGSAGGKELAGYDLLTQAVGGLMSITGPDPHTPMKAGVAMVDILAGLHAFGGILAALRYRDLTGEGQLVEVSLMSSLLSALTNQVSGYLGADVVPEAMGNRHPSICPYEVVDTADRPLALAVGNDKQFGSLVDELGIAHLADNERFATNSARVRNRVELMGLLGEVLGKSGAGEWSERLNKRGVPSGPVNNIAEAVAFAEQLGLDPVVEIADGDRAPSRQIAHPISFGKTAAAYVKPPPRLEDALDLREFLDQRATLI